MDGEALDDFMELCSIIQGVNTNPTPIGFRFNLNPDGNYTVNTLRQKIDSSINPHTGKTINWVKAIPLKVKCFVWRTLMDRLPVATNLMNRGIIMANTNCPLCNGEHETGDHLFVKCPISIEARSWIFKWCDIPATNFDTVNEFLNFAATWGNCPRKRERFKVVLYAMLWFTWLARNNFIFKAVKPIPTMIADEVISQTYAWFKYRTSELNCTWLD